MLWWACSKGEGQMSKSYAVGKYHGFEIYRDEEKGLYWEHDDCFFDSFKAIWNCIDGYNEDQDLSWWRNKEARVVRASARAKAKRATWFDKQMDTFDDMSNAYGESHFED
jgi:hypothetical protein